MGKFDDTPMGDLAVLKQRLAALAEELHMPLQRLLIEPDTDANGQHYLHATFEFDPEEVFKTSEQRQMDADFEAIARQARLEDSNEQVEKAREGAKDMLDDLLGKGKGILGDD